MSGVSVTFFCFKYPTVGSVTLKQQWLVVNGDFFHNYKGGVSHCKELPWCKVVESCSFVFIVVYNRWIQDGFFFLTYIWTSDLCQQVSKMSHLFMLLHLTVLFSILPHKPPQARLMPDGPPGRCTDTQWPDYMSLMEVQTNTGMLERGRRKRNVCPHQPVLNRDWPGTRKLALLE